MASKRPNIWIIGGLDPSAGAGILADSRMALALGVHPICIQTCNTVQNHSSCESINATDLVTLKRQLQLLLDMGLPDAIKIGLVPDSTMVSFLANVCASLDVPVVIDPVFKTSSGFSAADENFIESYKSSLIATANVLTPNLDEAFQLTGLAPDIDNLSAIAERLFDLGAQVAIIKGGHDQTQKKVARDFVSTKNLSYFLEADRLHGNFRGTGCALATAIACKLALGMDVHDAIVMAKSHIMQAMEYAYPQNAYQILNPQKEPIALPRLAKDAVQLSEWSPLPSPSTGEKPLGLYPILPNYDWIERLRHSGMTTVQLRIKDSPRNQLTEQIQKSVNSCSQSGIRLFINDYWQEAIDAGAYGVHLGQEDLDTADLDAIKKAGLRLGISTHSIFELARALTLKPSYVALGPIFETTCKSMSFGPQGIDRIAEWMRLSDIPVVAIGGLSLNIASKVRETGVSGVAVLSDITGNSEPENRTKAWIKALDELENIR